MWDPRHPTALEASTVCYRISFTFFTYHGVSILLAVSVLSADFSKLFQDVLRTGVLSPGTGQFPQARKAYHSTASYGHMTVNAAHVDSQTGFS
jgi:hypothetical protein